MRILFILFTALLLIQRASADVIVDIPAPVSATPPANYIQQYVDQNRTPGQKYIFRLGAGVFRMQEVRPKSGDTFIGAIQQGKLVTILNGSIKLTPGGWTCGTNMCSIPVNEILSEFRNGECADGTSTCTLPQDLYKTSTGSGTLIVIKRVEAGSTLQAGQWYYNSSDQRAYVSSYEVPNNLNYSYEIGVKQHAFSGDEAMFGNRAAPDVVIKDLIVEKYANPAQSAAIGGGYNHIGANWRIEHNEVRYNHGVGICSYGTALVRDNYVHHNGQMGMAGSGIDGSRLVLVVDNTIAYNNYAGYSPGWESGGTKFGGNITLRSNYVHHNYLGPGLWTDENQYNTIYEDNLVEYNEGNGIMHEISHNAIIRCNTVNDNTGNGDFRNQIFISTSNNVNIYDNLITVAPTNNGIILLDAARREDYFFNGYNDVHHNFIIHKGHVPSGSSSGFSGLAVADTPAPNSSDTNPFDFNAYYADYSTPSYLSSYHWQWKKSFYTWSTFPQEPNGKYTDQLGPLQLQNATLQSGYYPSLNTVTMGPSLTIAPNTAVAVRARQKITLAPGFHARTGSKFTASTCGCLTAGQVGSSLSPGTRNGRISVENEAAKTDVGAETMLYNASPNPTYNHSRIGYYINEQGSAKLWVSNLMGAGVMTLVDAESHPAGHFVAEVNTSSLAPGIYLYTLKTGNKKFTKRLVIIK